MFISHSVVRESEMVKLKLEDIEAVKRYRR